MLPLRDSALTTLVGIGLAVVLATDGAASGLPERPINLTCVTHERPSSGNTDFPQLLSETGCVESLDPSAAADGLIPYRVNSELWSDNADKDRWMALPDWSAGDTEIHIDADGDFIFPIGTVLMKSFSLAGQIVETRLLMRHDDGGWAGYSYEWNDAGTDAELLETGKTREVGGQTWTYPNRNQCVYCHSNAAGRSLGPEIAQLNGDLLYPGTGITANQLTTLEYIGAFDAPLPGPVAGLDRLPEPFDLQEPLDARARAYLHANCSNCHRPAGPAPSPPDFRYWIAGVNMGVLNADAIYGNLGVPGAKVLVPGQPELSVLSLRMHTLGPFRMPPLGSDIVDVPGTGLIDDWIRSGLGFDEPDTDSDGLADNVDNCVLETNASQADSDLDGIGNACDPDIAIPNDCIVNFTDLQVLKLAFFSATGSPTWNADADLTADGIVNFQDLQILKDFFFAAPGPSGFPNACD